MKLNFRLIRASQYVSQFNFDVRYRFDKIHLIFDALNKLLKSIEIFHTSTLKNFDEFIDVYANIVTFVK